MARGVVGTGWPAGWHFCCAEVGGQAGSGIPQLRREVCKAQVSEDVFLCSQVHKRLLQWKWDLGSSPDKGGGWGETRGVPGQWGGRCSRALPVGFRPGAGRLPYAFPPASAPVPGRTALRCSATAPSPSG